jgi:hypothetical protein
MTGKDCRGQENLGEERERERVQMEDGKGRQKGTG